MKDSNFNESKSTVQLSKYNNRWYKPGTLWRVVAWYIVSLIFFNNNFAFLNTIKCLLLRLFGACIGKRVVLKASVKIKYPWFLTIGDNTWVGEEVWIDNLAPVIIGRNVCISASAYLLTGNHNYKSSSFDLSVSGVTLEDGVWLGARSIVCPGIICKTHSVLTVGSVATQHLEPFTVYQGIPATKKAIRIIK